MQPSPASIEIMAETHCRTLRADAERVRAKTPPAVSSRAACPLVGAWRTVIGDLLIRTGVRIAGRAHTAAAATG